jgi:hypothetical protein
VNDNQKKEEEKNNEWKIEWGDKYMPHIVYIKFYHEKQTASRMKRVSDYDFEELVLNILRVHGEKTKNGEKEDLEIQQAYLRYDNEGRIANGVVCFHPSPSGENVSFFLSNILIFYITRMPKMGFVFY